MIHSITVTNHQDESLQLVLTNPELSGVAVASVEGLGPPKANINQVEMANIDGSFYTSSRAQARNIILQLIMMEQCEGAATIEESRHKIYRYFPLKKKIRLRIQTDDKTRQIWGYVESNEPYIFSKQEYCQISIVCPDPWFYDLGTGTTVFSGTRPSFEFPFSNESVTEKLIEFGTIWVDTNAYFTYYGDTDIGVEITIHAMGAAENITLYDRTRQQTMSINTDKIFQLTGVTFSTGDDIIINTVKGNKSARLLHAGQYYNIIAAIGKESDWFELTIGDNIFAFSADSGENNLQVSFSYQTAYGGI